MNTPTNTPDAMQGAQLHWPAEWEPMEAIWLSWPHRDDLWQGGLEALHSDYAQLAAAIAPQARVHHTAAAPLHAGIERLLHARGRRSVQQPPLFAHPTHDACCGHPGGLVVRRQD